MACSVGPADAMMQDAAQFHGYHPVQVVDDVINCFHDLSLIHI